jgi:sirohydrochlorin ferrochelatase
MKRAIVVVDHGSRLDAANQVVAEVARLVQERAGQAAIVEHAHMELALPSLPDAIARSVAGGALDIVVLPLFLVPGRHAAQDIPRLVAEAQQQHPAVVFRVGDVIGADPLLAELIWRRVKL